MGESIVVSEGEIHVFNTRNPSYGSDKIACMILLSKGTEYEPVEWLWGDRVWLMFDEFDFIDGLECMETDYTYEFSPNGASPNHCEWFQYLGPIDHPRVKKYLGHDVP